VRSALLVAAACCAALAPAAQAAGTTSSNWSGYAVMRSGLRFHRVSATWIAPAVDCTSAQEQWSAAWVGLGGYRSDSNALEQIGTEADCVNGAPRYSAWFELVPEVSRDIAMTIRPGDRVGASVTVTGRLVRLRLADDTSGRVSVRTLDAREVDVSSAEWIVEAPSNCDNSGGSCAVMPLADFGTLRMANGRATTTGGHAGTIADPLWRSVAITLASGGHDFGGPGGFRGAPGSATATPGALDAAGSAFAVSWAQA